MAGESNTIEIVIRAVDQMSADLQKVQAQMAAMSGVATQTGRAVEVTGDKFTHLNEHMLPTRALFFEVSNAARAMGPQFETLGRVSDHLAARLVNATASGEGFGSALAALLVPQTAVVAGIVILMGALGFLIDRFKETRKTAEELNRARVLGDPGPFQKDIDDKKVQLAELITKYNEMAQSVNAARTAAEELQRQQAEHGGITRGRQLPGLGTPDQSLIDQENKLVALSAEINKKKTELSAIILNNTLPALILEAQTAERLVNATDRQKFAIEAERQVQELMNKGLTKADAEIAASYINRKTAAEVARFDLQQTLENQKAWAGILSLEADDLARQGSITAAHEKRLEAIKEEEATDIEKLKLSGNIAAIELRRLDTLLKITAEGDRYTKELREQEAILAQGPAKISEVGGQTRLLSLQDQLSLLQKMKAPYAEILAIAGQIDIAQRDIYDSQIKQLQALNDKLVKELASKDANSGEAQVLRDQIGLNEQQIIQLRTKQQLTTEQAKQMLEVQNQAEQMAGDFAGQFTQQFMSAMEGQQTSLKTMFAGLGKTLVADFMKEFIKGLIEKPIFDALMSTGGKGTATTVGGSLAQWFLAQFKSAPPTTTEGATTPATPTSGIQGIFTSLMTLMTTTTTTQAATIQAAGLTLETAGSTLDFAGTSLDFAATSLESAAVALETAAASMGASSGGSGSLGFLSSLGSLVGDTGAEAMARGGMVVPPGTLYKFARGGMVRNGPIHAIVGEEGPELIARVKPSRPGVDDDHGAPIHQTIILSDQRRPPLGRDDVLLIVHDDMQRGGKTAKGVENILRRGGSGR